MARIAGADAPALTSAVAKHVAGHTVVPQSYTDMPPAREETEGELTARMRELMRQSPVVLFMKGSPDAPRCGFSRKTVDLLQQENVKFTHFDILTDESVRQGEWLLVVVVRSLWTEVWCIGLKVLNNWPTFPQLIVNGEFVGGLDVVKEAVESGEFRELLSGVC